ncbi:hypothetical protein PENDEC_c008G03864 [Penicillium decumbens]|uniref:Fungal N-terminal domain-containing protein n=1 Tax=Penicillium decumbens TaxID=69771 RepID=A0A1V6PDJ3_PENDC|nr:hypothetical protein PENDEC_c008G03864 [Penicillium decumbens]
MIKTQGSDASIVRIASAGFRLSLLLNAAACQLAQSRIEIHSIAKGISLFSLTLKHVGQTLESMDLERSHEATEKAWEIAGQGQMVFVEIERMLDKLQNTDADEDLKGISMQERLKWCFRKQYVTYLLAQLDSLKLSLIVMLQILQLGNMAKSSTDDVESPTLSTDDLIAHEKAETQNMIIVRYWSVKRLDRLWDAVEQEARDAANNPTSQRINSSYTSGTASALKPLVVATKGTDLTKLHIVTFGDSDADLGDIERSPKAMVHLSEKAMNRLLPIWVPSFDPSKLRNASEQSRPQPYVSSDSEDDTDSPDFDNSDWRGYYLEGKTVDWRKPQSQEARRQAAERRRKYSGYQAHVESDSEVEDSRHRQGFFYPTQTRSAVSNDEGEQRSNARQPPIKVPMHGRAHSNSFPSKYPPMSNPDGRPAAYPNSCFPANQPAPRAPAPPHASGPPQQPYKYNPPPQDYGGTASRSIPKTQSNLAPVSNPSPRGTPPGQFDAPWSRSQGYNPNMLQPRHQPSAYPLSTSSPESSFRPSPPRSVQRSPSHHSRSSREEAKERHRALGRNATRGLAGIGAIAGFMDALEAFSII